jgi:TolA-binding protein
MDMLSSGIGPGHAAHPSAYGALGPSGFGGGGPAALQIHLNQGTANTAGASATATATAAQVAKLEAKIASLQEAKLAQEQQQQQVQEQTQRQMQLQQQQQEATQAASFVRDTIEELGAAHGMTCTDGTDKLAEMVEAVVAENNTQTKSHEENKDAGAGLWEEEPPPVPDGMAKRARDFKWSIKTVNSEATLTAAMDLIQGQLTAIKVLFGIFLVALKFGLGSQEHTGYMGGRRDQCSASFCAMPGVLHPGAMGSLFPRPRLSI